MRLFLLSLIAAFTMSASAQALPVSGKPAPDFSTTDIAGKNVKLSELKGKIVVLEWNNPECPFVHKFYDGGAMQALQSELKALGIVWVSINSGAAGKQGSMDAAAAKAHLEAAKSVADHYLLDADGKIGALYGAKTTPHMFVIDEKGVLAYSGAIDDKPTADAKDIAGAKNYVREAVQALKTGKPVETASTQSYGCTVKY